MARPNRQGIDYFPYDVDLDQDDKLQMIVAEFKIKGEDLFTKLLCWIYMNDGYYTQWNEDVQLRFLRRYDYCGFSVKFLNEVVPKLIKWGIFDRTVFDSLHILTSARIQGTWLEATRKRKDRIIDERIWVLKVSSGIQAEETPLTPEETLKTPEEIPQSKVKKKKEKKKSSIGENGRAVSPPKKSLEEREQDMVIRQQMFYNSLVEYVPTYGKEMIRAFYVYWSEPNKSRTKFKKEIQDTWDTSGRLITWEKNQERFGKGIKKQESAVKTGPSVRELEEGENRKKLGLDGEN